VEKNQVEDKRGGARKIKGKMDYRTFMEYGAKDAKK